MSENLKKLTGKFGFEDVAKHLINNCDINLFKELVDKDDFLFDFVKQNVAQRISNAINENNYKNLLEFLKYYSPFYENVIISALVKYADEDLTDIMLEKFENGTDDEKAYCAKYFAYIQDPLAKDFLLKNAYSDNDNLAQNCASTLAAWKDEQAYSDAITKLNSDDDFEKLSAVKFLIAYGEKDALKNILDAMKTSTMAENIAGEIPYLVSIFELLEDHYTDALLVINHIINSLGEILPISVIYDFELFEVFEKLITNLSENSTKIVVLNAIEKFETLTENDEYLFDEDKDTKNEVFAIKDLLNRVNQNDLQIKLNPNCSLVFTALNFTEDAEAVKELLNSNNQTLILKSIEILKKLNSLDEESKNLALSKVTDFNIKTIINAL